VTGLHFRDIQINSGDKIQTKQVNLFTSGADKLLTSSIVDTEKVKSVSNYEDLTLMREQLFAGESLNNICEDKLFSMDIAEKANIMVTGHDR
jgi:hypothetical protein